MDFTVSRKYYELAVPTSKLPNIIQLDGMKVDLAGIRFNREAFTINQAAIVSASMIREPIQIDFRTPDDQALEAGKKKRRRGAYQAGDRDLEIINTYHAEYPRELEDFHIYQRVPVNNIPSRTIGIRFTEKALAKFALDASQGLARLRGHDKKDIVGRIFEGQVIEEEIRGLDATWLLTTEFISRRTVAGDPMNSELITKHVNGELGYDSIGFYPGSKVEFKEFEIGGKKMSIIEIDHDESDAFPLEMRESSFVHMGEIRGAGSRLLTGADDVSGAVLIKDNRSVVVSGQESKNALWVSSI